MKYTNIFEKIACLIGLIGNNTISLIFLVFVFFFISLLLFKIITKKKCFLSILGGYTLLLLYMIIANNKQLGIIGNSIINDFFKNIYFPSTYVYFFILLTIDIVTIISLIKNDKNKPYKNINTVFCFIIHFILIFILELLSKNKIDIFSKTSLFSNKELIILLELSVNVFIIWIITNLFVYLTNTITLKIEQYNNIEEPTKPIMTMNQLVSNINLEPKEEKPFIKEEKSIIMATEPTMNLNTNIITPKEEERQFIPVTPPVMKEQNIIPNIITPLTIVSTPKIEEPKEEKINFNLNDLIPVTHDTIIPTPKTNEIIVEQEEKKEENISTDNYTLNDYRIFNQILKEIKEQNNNNNIIINKELEYRIITKYSTETYQMFKQMLKIYSN